MRYALGTNRWSRLNTLIPPPSLRCRLPNRLVARLKNTYVVDLQLKAAATTFSRRVRHPMTAFF